MHNLENKKQKTTATDSSANMRPFNIGNKAESLK